MLVYHRVLAVFPDGLNQTRKGAPRHIFFHSDFGVANSFCDAVTFKAFYEAVKPMHGEIKRSWSLTDCMDTCVIMCVNIYMYIYIYVQIYKLYEIICI